MNHPDRLSLIELAESIYAEYVDAPQEERDQRFDSAREYFLGAARATAQARLGSTANELDWAYTLPDDLPAGTQEAIAPLAPGRPEYLRYRYTAADERVAFELVQPCGSCGHSRITEVSGLTKLGELLASKGGDR